MLLCSMYFVEIPELFTKIDDNELVINGMSDFQYNFQNRYGHLC